MLQRCFRKSTESGLDRENALTYHAGRTQFWSSSSHVDEKIALSSVIERRWNHDVDDTATNSVLNGSANWMIHEIARDGSSPP